MHNVKRLTMKLRKAQMLILEMDKQDKNSNEFTLTSKDLEIDDIYDKEEEIDEKHQLMIINELRERVEKYK